MPVKLSATALIVIGSAILASCFKISNRERELTLPSLVSIAAFLSELYKIFEIIRKIIPVATPMVIPAIA